MWPRRSRKLAYAAAARRWTSDESHLGPVVAGTETAVVLPVVSDVLALWLAAGGEAELDEGGGTAEVVGATDASEDELVGGTVAVVVVDDAVSCAALSVGGTRVLRTPFEVLRLVEREERLSVPVPLWMSPPSRSWCGCLSRW